MKKLHSLFVVSSSIGLVFGVLSCASVKVQSTSEIGGTEFYKPKVAEEMFGTWVNPAIDSPARAQKVVIHSWGLLEWYRRIGDKIPGRATSTIVKKWTDEEGNTWYRDYQRSEISGGYGESTYVLLRVNSGGRILEIIYAGSGWPKAEDMSPDLNTTYCRYERLE